MCSGGWGALRGTGPRATGPGGAFFFGALRGTGPRATGAEAFFFVVRGPSRLYQRDAGEYHDILPCPRDRFLILAILHILAILLQTERMRGTGPRATVKEARRPGHRSARGRPPLSFPHPDYPA